MVGGRWANHTERLLRSGYNFVLLIVEGDLSSTDVPHETLIGACINAEFRHGSHLLRTACVEESVLVIKQLVNKCSDGLPGIPSGIRPTSKRARDSETVWVRQLMCIPSISERISRKLLAHFGSLRAIQEALEDIDSFPRIRLDARTCIGKNRVHNFSEILVLMQTFTAQRCFGRGSMRGGGLKM